MAGKRSVFEEVGSDRPAATAAPAAAARDGARGAIRVWLLILLGMVALMVLVGGLTRLTDSGLSITEWNVVIGALPPLSQADWDAAFEAYKTTDEWRLQNSWMTLEDFKPIFWWEWGHRFMGRMVGVVWIVPLLWFWARGMIPRGWGGRLLLIGALGGLQGAIGWWMVYSGLSDRLDVAPYRLATHLGIAFAIFGFIFWYILLISKTPSEILEARRRRAPGLRRFAIAVVALLFVQILLGALVAGVDGGKYFTDWPLMDEAFLPASAFEMTPVWSNLFENPALSQFVHRMTAYALVAAALWLGWKGRRSGMKRASFWLTAFAAGIVGQALFGIVTLVHAAPTALASLHQLFALALLALGLRAVFETSYPAPQSVRG